MQETWTEAPEPRLARVQVWESREFWRATIKNRYIYLILIPNTKIYIINYKVYIYKYIYSLTYTHHTYRYTQRCKDITHTVYRYLHVHICAHACMHTHTYTHTHSHIHTHAYTHVCMAQEILIWKKPTVVFRWKTLVSYTSSPGKFVSSVNFCVNFSAHE